MKIKNKKKFVRAILIIVAIVSLFICKSTFSFSEQKYKTIYVSSGETLWGIAENEQKHNSYYKDKDIREIVYNIKNINNLQNYNLYEGQKLIIALEV